VELETDPYVALLLWGVFLCSLCFVSYKSFFWFMDCVFGETIILGHLEYSVPFSTSCVVCDGYGDHSVNVEGEGG
jgi:hypothetical protein